MTVKKLYFLPAGSCYLDQSAVNKNLAPGRLLEMPVWSFLLETTDGPILIDTGMPDAFVNNPEYFKGTKREGRVVPKMTANDKIVNILKSAGYHAGDIQAVISSHLHLDHAGGNGHFPKTPIFIQQAEFDAAMGNDDYSPEECRLPDLQYQIIEGDREVAPGVQIFSTPGHSPGHQSVLVTTEHSGPILLTIDVAYTRENFDNGVPFLSYDSESTVRSIKRMKGLIEKVQPSKVFFGHDRVQAREAKVFPDFL
ncbi:quorum-quenching N-acyl homoserine lactonase AiiA [Bacillus atrophaeus]|uniref:quorum-quenching N-acyl homoserine lactonase AiiA n=1 Tax=Bacillus atrophaeus TaxID=1452 RepID=UPI00077A51E7|nr:N-acyl homoserine lactonase family protein [Bacillus atrophaeus]KXZ15424.1 N-acyl homoserine lactonase [Bacillus atrophaeus]MBU5262697.1 N-acyl homoserine lactonase family protein [Bacillus atrophaeus]MCY8522556.1 N-acyl homoserine lactonase family protein [Bacillus atrophaeus]MCY8526111.1 N-acyl homoserine lactonase family protein [Bacillus atrophaeus]MCY8810351.1 N-acyl homoserine lactonase family protein [Bacillus atrophaeus]